MNKSEFINEFRLTKRANGEYVIEKRYYEMRTNDYYSAKVRLKDCWQEVSVKESWDEAVKELNWIYGNFKREWDKYPERYENRFEEIIEVYEADKLICIKEFEK